MDGNFQHYVSSGFAPRHVSLWEWFEQLRPGVKPQPKVDIWPRGGAKSTTTELACARAGIRGTRRFVLYVCKTQDLANEHIKAIGALLEALGVDRAVNKYNNSRGWTQAMLRASNGFNVLALGLDVGVRGIKFDEQRPDLIIFDDVDDVEDSAKTIKKKLRLITKNILPAGSTDVAVLFIQNLIHKDSIAARLADGRADFLLNRLPVTVEPAVKGLKFERRKQPDNTLRYVITAGEPTWEGQDLTVCEAQLNEWGRVPFLQEAQQEVDATENGLWNKERDIEPFRVVKHPPLRRIGVAVDPSNTAGGDEAGILIGGVGLCTCQGKAELHGFLLEDRSIQGSPSVWATEAVVGYNVHSADVLVAEDNNGGEMVEVTIQTIEGAPPVKRIHASRGKLTRAEPVQSLSEVGKIHHVGHHPAVETELCTWAPGQDSPNRLDAYVWLWTELLLGGAKKKAASGRARVHRAEGMFQ